VSEEMEEIVEKALYGVEALEWANNIGKTYIPLDFDKSKK
jgi:hypothetical protein